uniref:Uncharacterized protein n=1 Tax=Cannabis sativa TaxID=3483 RepID=A0A803PMK4_CANSA
MSLLNNILDAINSRSDEVCEVTKEGKSKDKKRQTSGSGSHKPIPPASSQEATPKALASKDLSTSVIDLIKVVLNMAALQQVPIGNIKEDSSNCDGQVLVLKKKPIRRSTRTTKDNQDAPLPPLTPKRIPATTTQLFREKTTLPPLPPPHFNLPIRPMSLLEEARAHMEAIEQFYLKRRGSEYDEMRKLAINISTKRSAEFANYDKWDEPFPNIINRSEMTERLRPRFNIDRACIIYKNLGNSFIRYVSFYHQWSL